MGVSRLILLANLSQQLPCGRHGKVAGTALMEERSSFSFSLQFTLRQRGSLESFNKLKRLLSAYIVDMLYK
jgi:hypothetical protein